MSDEAEVDILRREVSGLRARLEEFEAMAEEARDRAGEAVTAIGIRVALEERLEASDMLQASVARASSATARLCEATRRDPAGAYLMPWFMRREALAISAGENLGTDELKLLALAAGDPTSLNSKPERTASDILRATQVALSLDALSIAPGDIINVWTEADRSNQRRETDRLQWQIEQDSAWFAKEMSSLAAARTPGAAAEIFRRLYASKAFDGRARRMALILAPVIIRTGYAAPHALVGMATPVSRSPAAFEAALAHEDDFAPMFHDAVTEEVRRTQDALTAYARLEGDLAARLPPSRSTGRNRQALQALIGQPLLTAGDMARLVKATPKGGQIILERMVAAGVAGIHDPSRNKGRLYICRRAIGV